LGANGLQSWTPKGIAGRGVLVDYAAYAAEKGIEVAHFAPHAITLDDVKTILDAQGTELLQGDILFLRTGYVEAYKELSKEKKSEVAGVKEWCGLGQSHQTTEWLWQHQFAAVVSDSPGFEVRRKLLPLLLMK
jgi:kynurenine formamidase